MIEINLTSPENRKKKKNPILPGGLNIPMEVIVGSALGLMMLLVCVHIILMFINISKSSQLKKLQEESAVLLPEKTEVGGVMQEMRLLKSKYDAIEKITTADKIYWAEKLNIISNRLPKGVWLNRIALNDDGFFIDGSAISKSKDESINVHKFIGSLKKEKAFLENLANIEFGSILTRNVKNVEVADFLITASLPEEIEETDGQN